MIDYRPVLAWVTDALQITAGDSWVSFASREGEGRPVRLRHSLAPFADQLRRSLAMADEGRQHHYTPEGCGGQLDMLFNGEQLIASGPGWRGEIPFLCGHDLQSWLAHVCGQEVTGVGGNDLTGFSVARAGRGLMVTVSGGETARFCADDPGALLDLLHRGASVPCEAPWPGALAVGSGENQFKLACRSRSFVRVEVGGTLLAYAGRSSLARLAVAVAGSCHEP